MSEQQQSSSGGSSAPSPAPSEEFSRSGRKFTRYHKLRIWAVRGLGVVAAMIFLGLLAVGGAGWYTSRPEFCRSCHIMEPYFQSWAHSSHRDVTCIECHFAPGFGGKMRGKMLGLVQLAKYVTASAGPRPAAEIPDASCLRSGCHETRLLSGKVNFHGVPFDHTPHMGAMPLGKQLRCTSCHSQIVQGKHIAVTTTTCFLCHFKDQSFNQGLGSCTHCHQIPDKSFDMGGGVSFSHDLAYERGVDCSNCHGDLIRGKGEVPRERCLTCHNRESDLARIGDHVFMHKKHVTEHKVDCLNCHLGITHKLDQEKLTHARSECASCHPNHHQEQENMLKGTGAKSVAAKGGAMLMVRLECRTCHRIEQTSTTGAVLVKASAQVCVACHEPSIADKLERFKNELKASEANLQQAADRIRAALKSTKLKEERVKSLQEELTKLQDDLNFLRVGNGVHNIHYANAVTKVVWERLTALCKELAVVPPAEVKVISIEGGKK